MRPASGNPSMICQGLKRFKIMRCRRHGIDGSAAIRQAGSGGKQWADVNIKGVTYQQNPELVDAVRLEARLMLQKLKDAVSQRSNPSASSKEPVVAVPPS